MMLKDLETYHLVCTAMMVGLIWTIQLVHYPSFQFIEKSNFSSFESFHASRISFVVIPIMLSELLLALYLFWVNQGSKYWLLNLILLLLIWVSTMLISSRIHGQLMDGFDKVLIDKLIYTNWPRTILWSVKLLLLVLFSPLK